MPTRRNDRAQKYHAAIALLAESAQHDHADELAAILESAASAISLNLLEELAATCVEFWKDPHRDKPAAHGQRPRRRPSSRTALRGGTKD
jgi:hypothetical protein